VTPEQIDQALEQVRDVQRHVLESQRFKGYSGKARAFSGTVAVGGAVVMSLDAFPKTAAAHVIGWAVVFGIAIVASYGAVVLWFLTDAGAKRDTRRLRPMLDSLPPIVVGGVLTLAMIHGDQHRFLFGIWMSLFGLTNLSARWVLHKAIWPLGLYYVACGSACLLMPISFLNPWPMGVVFFIGEWIGGIIFYFDRRPNAPLSGFFLADRREAQGANSR